MKINDLPFDVLESTPLSGGDISSAYRVELKSGVYFLKYNDSCASDMFEKEALGLRELSKLKGPVIPKVEEFGENFILLEFLKPAIKSDLFFSELGDSLAKMHHFQFETYGQEESNYIGATAQVAGTSKEWPSYFVEKRLKYQIDLAGLNQFEKILDKIAEILSDELIYPSLLHGDLWSGNAYSSSIGAAIIDPAVYRGDREADIAMTEMFGGFSPSFYSSYFRSAPKSKNYEIKRVIYNWYHYLNHYNLFGGGYLGACEASFKKIANH